MKIRRIRRWVELIPLTRPYTVAFMTVSDVTNVIVAIEDDRGHLGLGAAAPMEEITGESTADCSAVLGEEGTEWLIGRDLRQLESLSRELERRTPHAPAARAALDMALHDLLAQNLEVPRRDMLGRAHREMPTSITIGIKSVDETLAEAREYVDRGFRVLKIKVGLNLEEDVERVARLRERFGEAVTIRVDPNQGYTGPQVVDFAARTDRLNIEFIEQPLPKDEVDTMRALPEAIRRRIAADESLHREADALMLLRHPRPCGIFNIKLMKCGGIRNARRIALVAELGGMSLMWGCMDESVISIAAALHTAFSSPATRYLDLDGSFDLARDVATGGFSVENGIMRTLDSPGLGLRLFEEQSGTRTGP